MVVVVVDEGGDGGLELAGEEVVLQFSSRIQFFRGKRGTDTSCHS